MQEPAQLCPWASPEADPKTGFECKLFVFGLLQKLTRRQGFQCKWFIWEVMSGNTCRQVGKREQINVLLNQLQSWETRT